MYTIISILQFIKSTWEHRFYICFNHIFLLGSFLFLFLNIDKYRYVWLWKSKSKQDKKLGKKLRRQERRPCAQLLKNRTWCFPSHTGKAPLHSTTAEDRKHAFPHTLFFFFNDSFTTVCFGCWCLPAGTGHSCYQRTECLRSLCVSTIVWHGCLSRVLCHWGLLLFGYQEEAWYFCAMQTLVLFMATVYTSGECSHRETNNLENIWTGGWMVSMGSFISISISEYNASLW